jgi:hypothetical protein
MRSHLTLPLSHIRPDRLTISIAATSAAVNHETVAAKIHAAVLSSLPDPAVDIAAEFDIEIRFDFRPFLTAPIIGRLRIGMFVETDSAANLNLVVANEIERAIRDYGVTRVIAHAQLFRAAIHVLLHWDGGSTIVVEKASRDAEIVAVMYGADPADVVDYLSAAGQVLVADHAGPPILEPGAGREDDAVTVMRAA